jgi:hypothetical protein
MTLQREQGLIESGGVTEGVVPDSKRMSRATGCGCFDDGTTIGQYIGFNNQILCACGTYRNWFKNYTKDAVALLVAPDTEKSVICKSAITYALIRYTPHLDALKLSEDVMTRLFPEGNNG